MNGENVIFQPYRKKELGELDIWNEGWSVTSRIHYYCWVDFLL